MAMPILVILLLMRGCLPL